MADHYRQMRFRQGEELTESQHIAQVLQVELMRTIEGCQLTQLGVSAAIYLVHPLVELIEVDRMPEADHLYLASVGFTIVDLWPLITIVVADVGVSTIDLFKCQ